MAPISQHVCKNKKGCLHRKALPALRLVFVPLLFTVRLTADRASCGIADRVLQYDGK